MDYLLTVSTGILSGIAASALFLWFSFSRFKPKIDISPNLAISPEGAEEPYIEVKFINWTRRHLNDVRVEILKSEVQNIHGGRTLTHTELTQRDIYFVSPFDRKDQHARYAFRVIEKLSVAEIWISDKTEFITVMVHASDSLSEFSQSFRKEYTNKATCLKTGKHAFGQDFSVAPIS
ncbi:hypothetical protein [Marinobacter sp.]|uniref:hypothetical protein n=1 Tax=Marinobacter sp. TaxID=50741 RepID=UPI002356E655|nr:hypothetical protein [Marinobacter sp.]